MNLSPLLCLVSHHLTVYWRCCLPLKQHGAWLRAKHARTHPRRCFGWPAVCVTARGGRPGALFFFFRVFCVLGREGGRWARPVFFLRAREKDLETLPRPDATLNGLFGHGCNPNNHPLGDSLLPAARVCRAERAGRWCGSRHHFHQNRI